MSSWSKPRLPAPPPFTPVNRAPLKGLTIGYHDGPPPPAQLAQLQALGVPLLCRLPVRNAQDAQVQLDALAPYDRLQGLLLLEDIAPDPSWTLDHFKLWGVQFGNEPDIPPYTWPATYFAARVLTYVKAWRAGGFTKRCVSGGIFSVEAHEDNGDWHAHAYLTPLLARARTEAPDLVVDVHWYHDTSDAWLARLLQFTQGFDVSVSEYGLPSRTPAEEHAQVVYLSDKDRAFYRLGALFTCVYQAASAPHDLSDEANYGLFRADGTAKPAFSCLAP